MSSITHSRVPVKTDNMSIPVHKGAQIAAACKVAVDPDPEPDNSLQARYEQLRSAYDQLAQLCDLLQTPCPNCPCICDMLKGRLP